MHSISRWHSHLGTGCNHDRAAPLRRSPGRHGLGEGTRSALPDVLPGFVRLRQRVSEDEVIAEFLKNDFCCPEFQEYQDIAGRLVNTPRPRRCLGESSAKSFAVRPPWSALARTARRNRMFKAEISQADCSAFVCSLALIGANWPAVIQHHPGRPAHAA